VVLAGFISWQLLAPTGVLHSNPPQCLSTFSYRVPCGGLVPALQYTEWSLVASAAMAGAVAIALRPQTR
jgi:hypothetical protein